MVWRARISRYDVSEICTSYACIPCLLYRVSNQDRRLELRRIMPERDVVLQDVIERLGTPVTDIHELLPLLCVPLNSIGHLPPQYRRFATLTLSNNAGPVTKVFPVLQHILLEKILPVWGNVFEEEGCTPLVQQYFCPDACVNATLAAGDVALCAYPSILSHPLNQYSVDLLLKLAREYPIDRLYGAITTIPDMARRSVAWDECLRDVFAIPSKVANALSGRDIPSQLGMPDYIDDLCLRCDALLHSLSTSFGSSESPIFVLRALILPMTLRRHVTPRPAVRQARKRWRIPNLDLYVSLSTIFFSIHNTFD